MRKLLLLLLVAPAFAQIQGNRPDVIDCYQSQTLGAPDWQIALPDGVTSGQVIVVSVSTTTSGLTISDTLGNTWTKTTETQTPAPQTATYVFMSYTTSGSTGADTVTLSGSPASYTMNVCRLKNVGAVDGSVSTATYTGNGSGGPGSFNITPTTGTNGDLLMTTAGIGTFGSSWVGPATGTEYGSNNAESTPNFLGFQHTGAKGSQTVTINTFNDFAFGSHATFAGQVLAFKPTAIAVTDTAVPQASAGVSYSMQLHGVGGTAALTYACTGLPSNGLSLNTGTGVISGATPTAGTVAIGCTVTDGTLTSATDSLSIVVSSSGFNSPSVRQIKGITGDGSGDGTLSSPVVCGDTIAVFYHGSDTHGANGWLLNDNGVNNGIQDTQGNVYTRIGPIAGSNTAPLVLYVARAQSSGNLTVTVRHSTTSGSGLNWFAADISGVQQVVDIGTFADAGAQTASPFSFNQSLTTVVPNELLFVATSTGYNNGESFSYSPLSVNSTNTSFCCYDTSSLGYTSVGSASTYTATATVTTGNFSLSAPGLLMAAFRPAVPDATCGIFTGAGERIRRQIW